jgi:anti-sigma regulatory factor (Ser/Thr protein kinase)
MADTENDALSGFHQADFVGAKRAWVLLITAAASALLGGAIALVNVATSRSALTAPQTLAAFAICLICSTSILLLRRGMYSVAAHTTVGLIFVVVWLLNLRDAYSGMVQYHTAYMLASLVPPALLLGERWTLIYAAVSLVVVGWMSMLLSRAGANWTEFAVDHTATILFIAVFTTAIAHIYSLALQASQVYYQKFRASSEQRLKAERESEVQQRRYLRDIVLYVTHGKLDICDQAGIAPYIVDSAFLTRIDGIRASSVARHKAVEFCRKAGLSEQLAQSFEPGVGEAIANAVKHAGRGAVYAGRQDDRVWVAVTDQGPGMSSLVLPRVALTRGFSTAASMGLGYTLMLNAADHILLHTDSHGTRVVLLKQVASAPTEPALEDLRDVW